jgi:hypothetical protein
LLRERIAYPDVVYGWSRTEVVAGSVDTPERGNDLVAGRA